jgi:hypothetical protein
MEDPGVRLGVYMDQSPGTGVAVWCLAPDCQFVQKFGMADVIRRLNARDLDGRNVGIRSLPRYLNRPCPRCGGSSFEARPDFQPAAMGFSR